MDNRYRSSGGQQDYRDRFGSRGRQSEQFAGDSDWQQGDDSWRSQESNRRWQSGTGSTGGYGPNENFRRDDLGRPGGGYSGDSSSLDDYDRAGTTRYGQGETTHSYFRGDDYGGQDYTRGRYGQSRNLRGYGSGIYGAGSYGPNMYEPNRGSIPPRRYDPDERGFFDRASDEVMSWFGDDDAARRREMDQRVDYRGKGPAGYTRSKERILEDANERLMHDSSLDASKITVSCKDNEITLDGTVDSRSAKRRAEDIVDNVSGVKHVQNNLRVEARESYYSERSTLSDS